MNTLKFTDADLKANREGHLSDAQQKRLDADVDMIQRHSKYMLWGYGLMFGVIALIALINGVREASSANINQLISSSDATGFVVMIGLFVFMAAIMGGSYWWSMCGLTHSKIRIIEGTADVISTYTTVKGMRVPLNRLRIHRGWFSRFTFHFQDAESLRYFKNGRRYRVYYLPYAMPQALSAEEIEPEKAKRRPHET
jgi:hypothetical protein